MKDRVVIPRKSPSEILTLVKRAKEKHIADADESLLRILKWEVIDPDVNAAVIAQQNVEDLKLKLAEAFQQRDIKIKAVTQHARSMRDVLTGAFPSEMKKMGQWGFTVYDARTGTKDAEPKSGAEPKDGNL